MSLDRNDIERQLDSAEYIGDLEQELANVTGELDDLRLAHSAKGLENLALRAKDVDRYQEWTRSTVIYPKENPLGYLALGLNGEAGEVAEKVKKWLRDHFIDQGAIAQEIGDVFWYTARIADEMGFSLSEVLAINRAKLESRKDRGVIGGSGDVR